MTVSIDVSTIATKVAALWAPASITPPTGLNNITLSTHLPPNEITSTPCVIVGTPVGQFEYGPGGNVVGELNFTTNFYFAKSSDLPNNLGNLYAWYSTLFARPEANYNLSSTASVVDVTITDTLMTQLTWGGNDFVGIQFVVRVRVAAGYNPVSS